MAKGRCELCDVEGDVERHHVIPQKILNEHKKMHLEKKYVITVCHACHKRMHNFLLEHLVNAHRGGKMTAFAAMRYYVMKKYLKAFHAEALKDFETFFKEFTDACVKDLDCEIEEETKEGEQRGTE